MKTKKSISIILLGLMLFSIVGVMAQYNIMPMGYQSSKMEQVQNAFQNRYQFNCSGNCSYSEFGENVKLQVQEKVRLFEKLNIQVEAKEEYVLDSNGEIIQSKTNVWSKILTALNKREKLE